MIPTCGWLARPGFDIGPRRFFSGHRIMREPFSRFASYYDKFMVKHVDYKGWVDYLEKLFRRFGWQPKRVLDVACGTSSPAITMARRCRA